MGRGNNHTLKKICKRGIESGKGCMYVYVSLNHRAEHLQFTQPYQSTLLPYKIKIKLKKVKIKRTQETN